MLTVHHLNNSRSQRVLWLLEELGVPYEIARYQRQPDMRAPKELRAIHPLGKSPVITDNGNTVAEFRRDRRIHHRHLWQWPADPAAEYAGAAALYLLAALCGRLGDAAAAAETVVLADAEARAGAAAPAGAQGVQPGVDHAGQSAAQAAHGVLGSRAWQERMVRRQRIHRRRHPDEFSAGSRLRPRRARGWPSEGDGVSGAHPRPARPTPARWKRAGRIWWGGRWIPSLRGALATKQSSPSACTASGSASLRSQ